MTKVYSLKIVSAQGSSVLLSMAFRRRRALNNNWIGQNIEQRALHFNDTKSFVVSFGIEQYPVPIYKACLFLTRVTMIA